MKKIIIVALTKDGKMGYQGQMPWDLPEELQLFKKITTGNTVIMGRNTWETIGKVLPNRKNIVVTSSQIENRKVIVASNFQEALKIADKFGKDIFFIGGKQIYQQALNFADEIFISWIKKDYPADLYFPKIDWHCWEKYYEHYYNSFIHSRYHRK